MRLDEGAGLVSLVKCGKVWMIWQTGGGDSGTAGQRIRQDQRQQPQRATLQRSL
jgi:hypothetical protein